MNGLFKTLIAGTLAMSAFHLDAQLPAQEPQTLRIAGTPDALRDGLKKIE